MSKFSADPDCVLRISLEPAYPPEHIIVLDRETLALNELHDGAALEISAFDLKLPPIHRVGYVRGASDRVPEFLRQAGLPIELLGAGELAGGDLGRYDAIVLAGKLGRQSKGRPIMESGHHGDLVK